MSAPDFTRLHAAVREAVDTDGKTAVQAFIQQAHMGRAANAAAVGIQLAELRRYRNTVSANPARLIQDSLGSN